MAVDVCDLCYGDLCRSCALPLKGRKDRVCKDCALTVSGVRGSGKPEVRGDRRTVKSRRKAYAALEEPEDFFQFFDTGLPADALATPPPPPPASRSDRERAAAETSANGSNSGPSTTQDSSGIRRFLSRLKPSEPDPFDSELGAVDEIVTDKSSHADGQDDEAGKDADAVSQLADIRRRDNATSRSDVPSHNPTQNGDQLTEDPAGATEVQASGGLPPGNSVAIPSTLLQGFPDADTDEPGDPDPFLQPDELADIATTREVSFLAPSAPPAALADDIVPAATTEGPPLHPDHEDRPDRSPQVDLDRVGQTPTGERRRAVHPVSESPPSDGSGPDAGAGEADSLEQPDNIPDMSPRLRDLVSDLSKQDVESSGASAENPFLKRSRVVSEPDAVPDFSTDPFAAQDRPSSESVTDEVTDRGPLPAPVSPSSPSPVGTIAPAEPAPPGVPAQPELRPEPHAGATEEPGEPGEPAQAYQAPDPDPHPWPSPDEHPADTTPVGAATPDQQAPDPQPVDAAPPDPQAADLEPVDAATPDPQAADLEPIDPGSAVAAQPVEWAEAPIPEPPDPVDPASASLDPERPAPESLDPENPQPEPLVAGGSPEEPEAEKPDPSTAEVPPSRPHVAAYTPEERHPLAAFADSDRHPLAAFARQATPAPPSQEPPATDDVVPSEPAAAEGGLAQFEPTDIEPGEDGLPATTDLPPIDDLLPPIDDLLPPIDGLPPSEALEAAEGREEPQETWEPWEPADFTEEFTGAAWSTPAEVAEDATLGPGWELIEDPGTGNDPDLLLDAEPTEDPGPAEEWEFTHEPDGGDDVNLAEEWGFTELPPLTQAVDVDEEPEVPQDPAVPPVFLVGSNSPAFDEKPTAWGASDGDPGLEETTRRPADTDARGSWIPPALRGIAPDAEEAAENLPRRRR